MVWYCDFGVWRFLCDSQQSFTGVLLFVSKHHDLLKTPVKQKELTIKLWLTLILSDSSKQPVEQIQPKELDQQ